MERLNIIWKFVQALVTAVVRQKKRVCIAAAAGTAAVVLTGVGVLAVHHATGTRQSRRRIRAALEMDRKRTRGTTTLTLTGRCLWGWKA